MCLLYGDDDRGDRPHHYVFPSTLHLYDPHDDGAVSADAKASAQTHPRISIWRFFFSRITNIEICCDGNLFPSGFCRILTPPCRDALNASLLPLETRARVTIGDANIASLLFINAHKQFSCSFQPISARTFN